MSGSTTSPTTNTAVQWTQALWMPQPQLHLTPTQTKPLPTLPQAVVLPHKHAIASMALWIQGKMYCLILTKSCLPAILGINTTRQLANGLLLLTKQILHRLLLMIQILLAKFALVLLTLLLASTRYKRSSLAS